jgi:hypothetical protein
MGGFFYLKIFPPPAEQVVYFCCVTKIAAAENISAAAILFKARKPRRCAACGLLLGIIQVLADPYRLLTPILC